MPETAAALQEIRERIEQRKSKKASKNKHEMKWEAVFQHLDRARKVAESNPTEATQEVTAAAEWSHKWCSRSREETSMGLTILQILEKDVLGAIKASDTSRFDGAVVTLRRVVQREAVSAAVKRAYSHLRRLGGKRAGDTVRTRTVEDAIENVFKELSLRRGR
jgi:hypothetical protein